MWPWPRSCCTTCTSPGFSSGARTGPAARNSPWPATGEHHVLSVAESITRKIPAPVVVAQACAHTHPGTAKDEAQVVGWIKAAALLAGVDPVRADLLAPGGETLPLPRRTEGFLVHLGDHDFVLSVPAAQWVTPVLRALAEEKYGLKGADLDGLPATTSAIMYSRSSAPCAFTGR